MVSETEIIIRIIIIVILSGLIGLERKHYHKPAGFRTNVLVGLGSTTLAITAIFIYNNFNASGNVDIGRMVGQIITGIGFLGAGAIIQARGSVHGLTTAASIWVVAAIGMAIGLGYYFVGVAATLTALIILVILGRVEHRFEKTTKHEDDNEQSE